MQSLFLNMKQVVPKKDYLISDFTKEELEVILKYKTVKFWTKDCSIMPDFTITALVSNVATWDNGETRVDIIRKKTGRATKTMSLSTRMHNLKFRIMGD